MNNVYIQQPAGGMFDILKCIIFLHHLGPWNLLELNAFAICLCSKHHNYSFSRLFGSISFQLNLQLNTELFINFIILFIAQHCVWDFNACDNFIVLVITCHNLAASLEVLSMQSLDDTPVLPLLSPELQNEPQNMWMLMDSQ